MAVKSYDAQQALDPGVAPTAPEDSGKALEKLIADLPEEYRDEVVSALAAIISYIHSDEGTTAILKSIQDAKGKEAQQIGIASLQAMDAADVDHKWRDPVKVICGYIAVSEIAGLAKEAGLADITTEQAQDIFKQAAQNYLHAIIKNKATPEERDAEAIRIQKEVEPLMDEQMRGEGYAAAKKHGIPHEGMQGQQGQSGPPQQGQPAGGGLLE